MENIIDLEILSNGEYKIIELNETKLLVFKNGTIYRWCDKRVNNYWKIVKNTSNNKGYNKINLNKKDIFRHRIMGFTFRNLDINDTKQLIDHIDGNKLNNNIDNLRVVTHQQNLWNTKAKGFYWNKRVKKWCSKIQVNNQYITLGYFDNEIDARNTYLEAKKVYHFI